MDETTVPTAAAPAPAVNPVAASLALLKDALDEFAKVVLVTEDENEATVKAASPEAKSLLKAYRAEHDPDNDGDDDSDPAADPDKDGNAVRGLFINMNITPDQQRQIDLATEQFMQSVTRVDSQILALYIQAIKDDNYAEADAILANISTTQQARNLTLAMLTIGTILLPIYARQRVNSLLQQFGLPTVFANTTDAKKAVQEQAEKGADSHVHTVAKDIKSQIDGAVDEQLPTVREGMEQRFPNLKGKDQKDYLSDVRDNKEIYQYAQKLILKGDSRIQIIKKLQDNFNDVNKNRATTLANNESNRIFTLSQYEADEQFLAQNKLTDKAYKRLISNTGTPCPICADIITTTNAHPIPFKEDFVPFGKTISVKYVDRGKERTDKFTADYERIRGGHIHVNCHCRYDLLIKQADGTWLNSNTGKVENDFLEDLHPRDHDGKFAPKGTQDIVDGVLNTSKINDEESFNNFVENSKQTYSAPEARAAKLYQSPQYYKLNTAFQVAAQNVKLNDTVINLDKYSKVFDPTFNIKTKTSSTLYRGVGEQPSAFKPGQEIDNDGYTSTSFVEKTARGKFKGPGGSVINLTVPAGTHISVPDLVARDITNSSLDEQEAVLQRGTTYRVDKVVGDVVYATVV